ncbi:MAG: response regulator transcription factor [Bryobacteraceae bacterium]|nr:response regulator transcription factor [Bryobacteraceae bacterium]MDW8378363.1 response regulator transcription factor [Bryobacterales bacterium]
MNPNPKIRVLVADDHAILRKGMAMLINSQPDMELVSEAGSGEEVVREGLRTRPDVIVMDVSMPGCNGIEATRRLLAEMPNLRILGLSMHKDAVYVRELLRAGATAYLVKDCDDGELLLAIRAVARGDAYLSPAVTGAVLNEYRRNVSNPVDLLTAREREVLVMIAEGKTNKEIAAALGISVYTVESYRGSLMEKLNLHNTGDIVRFALRNGLVT